MSLVIGGTFGSLLCALVVYLWSHSDVSMVTDSSTRTEEWVLIPIAICMMGMMIMGFFLGYYLLDKARSACCTINRRWRKL